MNDEYVMNNLHSIEKENRKLEKIYPVILRATYDSRTALYTIRMTDRADATTQIGEVKSYFDSVITILKASLEEILGDVKLVKNIGETEQAKEALTQLGFAHDSLISIKSSCSSIDTAIIDVENAVQKLKEYFEWAGLGDEF